jgi:hypothetical protein
VTATGVLSIALLGSFSFILIFMDTNTLGSVHPMSPKLGDIVTCAEKDKQLTDPKGYRVESLGWSKGYGVSYGCFAARGVSLGGLYEFSVTEWLLHSPLPNDKDQGRPQNT